MHPKLKIYKQLVEILDILEIDIQQLSTGQYSQIYKYSNANEKQPSLNFRLYKNAKEEILIAMSEPGIEYQSPKIAKGLLQIFDRSINAPLLFKLSVVFLELVILDYTLFNSISSIKDIEEKIEALDQKLIIDLFIKRTPDLLIEY